jgi:hypothetical protein
MKHIKKLNEAISGTISTSDLYVVKTYSDTDISTLYASKRTAEKELKRLNQEHYDYYKKLYKSVPNDTFDDYYNRNVPKYKVMTLYDAIEDIKNYIKEDIHDEYSSHGDPSY